MARILKNMADLFSKQEKTRDILNLQKNTEQLRSYQVQRDILMDEQFSHDFSSSVCFLFAITNGMVKVLMEGCFGSCFFQFTEIKSAIFFLMRAIEAFQRK